MSESKYREAYNKGFKDGENHAFDGYVQQCYDELPYEKQIEMLILRQIRAEIEQNAYPIVHGVNNHEKGMTLYGILQIIDKYKEQTE